MSAASVGSSQKPHAAERQVTTGEVNPAVNHLADLYVSRVACCMRLLNGGQHTFGLLRRPTAPAAKRSATVVG